MAKTDTRIQKKNQAAIMDAGLAVFSQFGFRGSTLDQVAEAAGLSKPNLLYYFRSKDAIYTALLAKLLENWLEPLREINAEGDPVQELLGYANRKLDMSQHYPRESRLFANEIIQGAPRIADVLQGELRGLVDEISQVINDWVAAGRIKSVDPRHLIFSIWALTQHYADFDVQVRAILGDVDPFDGAQAYLEAMLRGLLEV
ncbi:TetR family transcriptional regulator C-terminal domain-containing protein [Octadecabacter sp.]|jgi:TetR/AcrR family transcriptional regulator|nr:TetR family transcriptional regulator C-terminal domain-containing protein [Octadecabacter sp.]MDC1215851.1 TetR family transcriptional regulator C-terminal domain-containing protein [Octadecabacter sp.]MDC1230916.1 TetR family transcriptional regulator C-terminal domain-containing protein [Octadecabacter sp.]MDC1381751.1 TetR family transcriptional regulator C-terminal domain-containing protein [Octadecabacter sp.]MDC1397445.1 TetR family transcriptional regulator C-terminal domain-containi|tara:strand:- start:3746 stop:4348 length:603 start_codon:yes stop_codon:yes gene_type:complete